MRLTSRNKNGQAYIWVDPEYDTEKYVEKAAQKFKEAIEKLARHEDANEPDPETGLKPCPMCGGKNLAIKYLEDMHEDTGIYTVVCGECKANGGYRDTEAEAIAAWNRRAGEKE